MDKTSILLNAISKTANWITNRAQWAAIDADHAKREYELLTAEHEYLTGPEDMEEGINAAAQLTDDALRHIHELDKQLMKLIQLRGQLAEQLDIPIGGAKWVRYETYTM